MSFFFSTVEASSSVQSMVPAKKKKNRCFALSLSLTCDPGDELAPRGVCRSHVAAQSHRGPLERCSGRGRLLGGEGEGKSHSRGSIAVTGRCLAAVARARFFFAAATRGSGRHLQQLVQRQREKERDTPKQLFSSSSLNLSLFQLRFFFF